MRQWIKKHWQTVIISVLAVGIFYYLFSSSNPHNRLESSAVTNPFMVAMGKWGIRFLMISLACSPVYALTGWRLPLKLRKPAGLWAFFFVCVHVFIAVGIIDPVNIAYSESKSFWTRFVSPYYMIFGTAAFVILSALALTSVKPAMRLMGRNWKRLHRLVYAAGVLMMIHSILVATNGKRAFMGGEESAVELRIYLYVILALLALRIPFIKRSVQRLLPFGPKPRKKKQKRLEISSQTG